MVQGLKLTRLIIIQNVWRCDDNQLLQAVQEAEKMDTVIIGNVDAGFQQSKHQFKKRSSDFISFISPI